MTLVEAAVATAILGSLLSGLVVASGNLTRQSRQAELTARACGIAEQLLSAWRLADEPLPRSASGPVLAPAAAIDQPGWTWRTSARRPEAGSDLARLKCEIVMLEIFPPGDPASPACAVELLLPAPAGGEGH